MPSCTIFPISRARIFGPPWLLPLPVNGVATPAASPVSQSLLFIEFDLIEEDEDE